MAFDTATAKEGQSAWVENAPDHVSCKDVQMTAGAASQIWVGCDDRTILVVDKATANKQLIQVEGGSSLGLWSTDIAGDYAYGFASTTLGKGCNLMRFDMATATLQQRATIGEGSFGIDKILVDDDAVWLLAENDFHLVQVDPTTLAVSAVVPLGEDPANPTGPRVDTRGRGSIEQIGNKIWAVDASSTLSSLISIDKIALATTWVDSLADLAALGDGGVGVTANHTSLFAWNCDSSKQGTIVRLDGSTGQRLQTYTVGIGGLCNRLTFTERKLYAPSAESPYKLVQMDLQSGAITATFTFANPVEEVVRR